MEIKFYNYGTIDNKNLKFAIILSMYKNKYVFVKTKKRGTWEMPAGHREPDEDINITASRELREETGAKVFTILPINDYSVKTSGSLAYGRLFYANIKEFNNPVDKEIEEVELFDALPDKLSYPKIQPVLFEKILKAHKPIESD
jgi:8-oxo-dGTP diphosphatase